MTALKTFVETLRRTEWLSAEELARYQRKPLEKLVRHAYETVPFYRERLAVLFRDDGSIDWERWEEVPVLTRAEVQDHGNALASSNIPEMHGATYETQSSGTTGSPIAVQLTILHEIARGSACARHFDWHGIDRRGTLATIRPLAAGEATYPDGECMETWPEFAEQVADCGPFIRLNSNTPIDLQVEWIVRNKPDYLLTLASNAGALAAFIGDNPEIREQVELKKILSYAEIVSDEIRARCRKTFGLELIDCYSARECGYIALQCPSHTHYHVQSEVIRVEVLDDHGMPCQPGETGRVIVTPLYNYAMPLIRYGIHDHAEVGEACPCGRAHSVLARIAGRTRNMFQLPDGQLIAPDFKTTTFMEFLSPRQWQIAQTGPMTIEVRLVPGKQQDQMKFDAMTDYIRDVLNADFDVRYRMLDAIALRPGGKHEDYVCEIDSQNRDRPDSEGDAQQTR